LIEIKDLCGLFGCNRAIEPDETAMDILSADNLSGEPHGAQLEAACGELCLGCAAGDCQELLREAGLRPTRQRMLLGQLLFAGRNRHVTAESLHAESAAAGMRLSLATVYNTLNQFTQAGLLRRIGPDGSRCFFDTDTSVHPHFYLEGEDILIDVPEHLAVEQIPTPLPGHEISRLDIVIRIRRKTRSSSDATFAGYDSDNR
jgi:Fur family iron response transcriptional regulator